MFLLQFVALTNKIWETLLSLELINLQAIRGFI